MPKVDHPGPAWRHRKLSAAAAVAIAASAVAPQAAAQQAPPESEATPQPATVAPSLLIKPRVALTEILTDNARGIGANVPKRADLISRLSPGIFIHDESARVNATLDYSANFDKYLDNSDLDQLSHRLLAHGTAELARQLLFVDANASVSKELINRTGAIVGTDRNVPGNTSTVSSVLVSPYLRNHLGSFADSELRYSFGETTSGDDVTANGTFNQLSATLNSGSRFSNWLWTLSAAAAQTDSGSALVPTAGGGVTSESSDTKRVTVQLQNTYVINRNIALLGGIGYERIDNDTLSDEPHGLIWNAGVQLTPGPRTKLKVRYNSRFDDHFISADGEYKITEISRIRLSYDESISTEQDQRFFNLGNLGVGSLGGFINSQTGLPFNPLNPGFGSSNSIGNAAFRDRRGTLALILDRDRNTYTGELDYESRKTESTDIEEKTYGARFAFTRQLSEKAGFAAGVQYQRNLGSGGGSLNESVYRANAGVTYALGETVQGALSYVFLYRDSSQDGQTGNENTLLLSLSKTF